MNDVTPQTRAARHLTQIVAMYDDLSAEAVHRANDRHIPGGDALVLLAPGADLTAYKFRQMSNLMGRIEAAQEETSGDPDPVLQVLAYWDDEIRAERGEPTDLSATVKRTTDYIRQTLDWAFDQDNFDADAMLTDLGRLRSRMENVLKQGYRPDRTQVPCLEDDCDATLNKEWHTQAKYDGYRCPQCERFYDRDSFIRAKAHHLHSQGADRFVRYKDAVDAIDRSLKTIYKWVADGKVQTEIRDGHTWVWWPDIRQLHVETPTRDRKKGA